jgi:hypothetical protein
MNAATVVDGLLASVERGRFEAEPALLETLLDGLGYEPLIPLIVWFADAPPTSSRDAIEAIITRQLSDEPLGAVAGLSACIWAAARLRAGSF